MNTELSNCKTIIPSFKMNCDIESLFSVERQSVGGSAQMAAAHISASSE